MIRQLRLWRQRRRHRQAFRALPDLLAAQRLSPGELARRQHAAFDDMVRFAAANTDYYADRFADALRATPGLIAPACLPVLTRDDVVAHRDAMLVRGAGRGTARLGHTGGSTGTPMAFYYDEFKHELMLAGMMRGFMLSGWRPGQKVLYLWGAARDVDRGGVFAHRGDSLLDTDRTLAAFDVSEARLHAWVRTIQRWRPTLLYGYASVLGELARFVLDRREPMPRSLRGVYSTAEVLHDVERTRMRDAFGCTVFNQYGCREVPNIAWECRAGSLHVFSDLVLLESLPVDGEDRLVVTSLSNRLMPFIRYELGDTGRLLDDPCACGLPFPRMQMDLCRRNDMIRTRDGRKLHPAYFNRLLYGLAQIRQYQWRQIAPARLALDLVSAGPLPGETVRSLISRLRADFDPEVTLEVNYRDEIVRTGSGKHRFVIGLPDGSATATGAAGTRPR